MSNLRKPFAIYAITTHGIGIATRLLENLPGAELFVSEKLFSKAPAGALQLPLPMGPTLAQTFTAYDCHIHVISIGAVVRMIAPLLQNKKVDPAIVCVDDAARFSICVLSGHVGRGNVYTERVAKILGAQAVVTTASDVRGTLTVDILGRDLGWKLDDPDRNVTRGCAAVVNEAPVLFVQETGEPGWWPAEQALPKGVQYAASLENVDPKAYEILLIASDRDLKMSHPSHFENAVVYRPKSLVLGLGCDRDIPPDLMERGVMNLLEKHGLAPASVKAIATIDVKSDERALLQLSQKKDWPLKFFNAAELDAVEAIENPSETVKKHVKTRGVAEPAALLASGAEKLLVPKVIYKEPCEKCSMTFAVARIPFLPRTPPIC